MKKQKKTRARRKIAAGADLFSNEIPIPDADFFTAETASVFRQYHFSRPFITIAEFLPSAIKNGTLIWLFLVRLFHSLTLARLVNNFFVSVLCRSIVYPVL